MHLPVKDGFSWPGNTYLPNDAYSTFYSFNNDDDMGITKVRELPWPLPGNQRLAWYSQARRGFVVGNHADKMLVPNDPKESSGHSSPSFETDWYGQVLKDLQDLYGPKPRGRYSRIYCGGGSRAKCTNALRKSLRAALGVNRQQLYGKDSHCSSRPEASCSDETLSTSVSGVSIPAFPLQNRPTYQQIVEIARRVAR